MFKKRVLTIAFMLIMLFSMALIASADDHTVTNIDDLQTKITEAAAGDTLILANGTYNLPVQIAIDKNITIKGASSAGVVIKAGSGFPGDGTSMFKISDATSVTIQDLSFEEGRATDGSNYAIEIANSAVTLENITTNNFKSGGILVSAAAPSTSLTIQSLTANEKKAIEVAATAVGNTTVSIASLNPDTGLVKTREDVTNNMVWYQPTSDEAKATKTYIVAKDAALSSATHYNALTDAVTASNDGDTIYIKTGEHIIDAPITFTTKNVNLTGVSGTTPTIKAGNVFNGEYLISLAALTGEVKITNLNLVGNGSINPKYGINISGCKSVLLKDVNINSFVFGGVNTNGSIVTLDGLKTDTLGHGINFANSATPAHGPSLKETGAGFISSDPIAIRVEASAKTVFDADRGIIDIKDIFWLPAASDTYTGHQNPSATTVTNVIVTKTNDISGKIEVIFSADMSAAQPGSAEISFEGGTFTLESKAWSQTDKNVYSFNYKNLEYGKTYILNIKGFVDSNNLPIATYKANLFITPATPAQNSTLNKTSITSAKENNAHKDQTVTLTLNGNTLTSITNRTYTLVKDTDYTVSGNTITIKGSYLNTLTSTDYVFNFNMSAGATPTLAIKLTTAPPPWVNPFKDVAKTNWFYPHVEYVMVNNLFTGVTDSIFAPDGTLTRGMMVTLLGRLADIDPSDYTGASFGDVSTGEYYAPYVKWASEKKIVNGIGNNKFAPAENISRQDLATIMHRYAQVMKIELPVSEPKITFSDSTLIASYAVTSVEVMQRAGIINGKLNNLFDPLGTSTRAETAALLHGFIDATK
jgi:S-layer homology domain./Domain of unknown function.